MRMPEVAMRPGTIDDGHVRPVRQEGDLVVVEIVAVNDQGLSDFGEPRQVVEGAGAAGNDLRTPDPHPPEQLHERPRPGTKQLEFLGVSARCIATGTFRSRASRYRAVEEIWMDAVGGVRTDAAADTVAGLPRIQMVPQLRQPERDRIGAEPEHFPEDGRRRPPSTDARAARSAWRSPRR